MSTLVPAEVDARGNFNPHYQEGLKVPVRDADVNNVAINISSANWEFRSPSIGAIPLVVDPANVQGLLLIIPKADVQKLPPAGEMFVIVDVDATPDDVRWEGKITPRGWK